MELNKEQIIKTIQDCIDRPNSTECPNLTLCLRHGFGYLFVEALVLIEKLTEENETLHTSCTELKQECKKWQGRLKIECEYTKSDAVRKMQERVKAKILEINGNLCGLLPFIDQIAKEMLENTDERFS